MQNCWGKGLWKGAKGWGPEGWAKGGGARGIRVRGQEGGIYILMKFSTKQLEH